MKRLLPKLKSVPVLFVALSALYLFVAFVGAPYFDASSSTEAHLDTGPKKSLADLRAMEPTPMRECRGPIYLVLMEPEEQDRGLTSFHGNPNRPPDKMVDLAFLNELAEFYRHRYGIDARVLGSVTFDRSAFDASTEQYVGEKLIEQLDKAGLETKRGVDVIGVLNEDIRLDDVPEWRYAFSTTTRYTTVLSSYRMASEDGENVETPRFRRRVHVMISSLVASYNCSLPNSDNPNLITFVDLMGPEDLDRMNLDLLSGRTPALGGGSAP